MRARFYGPLPPSLTASRFPTRQVAARPKGSRRRAGHLIPGTPFELAAVPFLEYAAPLFKEKCDSLLKALVANIVHPRRLNRTSARTRLATTDHPINPTKIKLWKWGPSKYGYVAGRWVVVRADPAWISEAFRRVLSICKNP